MALQFGIPSLDDLLDPEDSEVSRFTDCESMAILGPDGSGKSVLALHLASRYLADCVRQVPASQPLARVLYVSSDLKKASADRIWNQFELRIPERRQIPFERIASAIARKSCLTPPTIRLREVTPEKPEKRVGDAVPLVDFLVSAGDDLRLGIGFLDLASHTEGDDWNFVNSVLGMLKSIQSSEIQGKQIPHLVIIDSVAGFETFVGKLDAYGMEQSRRARIAQCMRNAGGHCHLVFVVEEPKESEHLPEEFVTDLVLRLRNRSQGGTFLHSLEIEKARARAHAVGEHPFEIRDARGTSTGDWENADKPRSRNAYVQVFQSLAFRNWRMGADPINSYTDEKKVVSRFGLRYLDRLLPKGDRFVFGGTAEEPRGLNAATTTALIGDASTGKSNLGEKFLAEGFAGVVRAFILLHWGVIEPDSPLSELGVSVLPELALPATPHLPPDWDLAAIRKQGWDKTKIILGHIVAEWYQQTGQKNVGKFGNLEERQDLGSLFLPDKRAPKSRTESMFRREPQTLGGYKPRFYVREDAEKAKGS